MYCSLITNSINGAGTSRTILVFVNYKNYFAGKTAVVTGVSKGVWIDWILIKDIHEHWEIAETWGLQWKLTNVCEVSVLILLV